jgi:hypothetical protein
MRIFGLWCLAFGHRSAPESRRNFEGNLFAECKTCSRELFRDPARHVWRPATAEDRRPRKLALLGEENSFADPNPDQSSRRRRRSSSANGSRRTKR